MKLSQILTVTFAICLSTMAFAQSKITINVDSIEGNNPSFVKFSYTPELNPLKSAHWDFGNNSISTDDHPKTAYTQAGNYNIELIIGQDTGRLTLPITNGISAPNVFSPNGDNLNDYFEVKYDDKTFLSLKIFTRTGALIYNKDPKIRISWDGYLDSGEKVLQGMYFYIIETVGVSPVVKKKGFVYVYY